MENSNDKDESMERHGDEERKKSKFRVLAGENSTAHAQMCFDYHHFADIFQTRYFLS
jgi:hypothetical protein